MFNIGDEVEFTDECDPFWFFGPKKEYKSGVIISERANGFCKYTVMTGKGLKGFVQDRHITPLLKIVPYTQFQTGDTDEDI